MHNGISMVNVEVEVMYERRLLSRQVFTALDCTL